MDWTELILTVPTAQAAVAEAIATGLCEGGLYIEDYTDLEKQVRNIAHVDLIEQELLDRPRDVVKIHLYLSPDDDAAPTADRLQGLLLAGGIPYSIHCGSVRQEEWETSWKKYYKPVEIGSRLAVAPSWEEYESDRITLRLDPGMAFGTGTHETTVLCLELLEQYIAGGERLLDIGTGSGILAVAALLLGAGSAEGIDIDPMSVRTALENARLNGVRQRFTAETGDLAAKAHGQYSIVTANIVADAIIRLAPALPPLLAAGGLFVASGIIDEREEDVKAALQETGLQFMQATRKRGWVALLYKKA